MNRSIRISLLSALIWLPIFGGCSTVAQAESPYDDDSYSELFSEAELARLLAPIALYPDTLLTHILIASSYPLEVVEANRWFKKNRKLNPKKLMRKAEKQGWDPSVTALVAFPDVLERMSDDLDWTRELGDAFLDDEEDVLDTIQMLRREADRAGNLDGGEYLVIKRQPTQIIIESPRPEVIFVPYYDPREVYGRWRWRNSQPVYWAPFPGYVSYHRHFGWHSGVNISFNFYFSNFHWHDRHVIVHHHHHYRRPPEPRYAISHGAQRWNHNPNHRRGVEYRSIAVRERYGDDNPSRIERNHPRSEEGRSISGERGGLERRDIQPRSIGQAREQEFRARGNDDDDERDSHEERKGDNSSGDETRSRIKEINDNRTREHTDRDKDNNGWRIDEARTKEVLQPTDAKRARSEEREERQSELRLRAQEQGSVDENQLRNRLQRNGDDMPSESVQERRREMGQEREQMREQMRDQMRDQSRERPVHHERREREPSFNQERSAPRERQEHAQRERQERAQRERQERDR